MESNGETHCPKISSANLFPAAFKIFTVKTWHRRIYFVGSLLLLICYGTGTNTSPIILYANDRTRDTWLAQIIRHD